MTAVFKRDFEARRINARRAMLGKLDQGVSIMAHAVLLRCILLADERGDAVGLLSGIRAWGMTRTDVMRALEELERVGLVSMRWAPNGGGKVLNVRLVEWDSKAPA